jgi:hypothetical protein
MELQEWVVDKIEKKEPVSLDYLDYAAYDDWAEWIDAVICDFFVKDKVYPELLKKAVKNRISDIDFVISILPKDYVLVNKSTSEGGLFYFEKKKQIAN